MTADVRPLHRDDWRTVLIAPGQYANTRMPTGYLRRDGCGGNPLHPATADDRFEEVLAQSLAAVGRASVQDVPLSIHRLHARMPYWRGHTLPRVDHYEFISQPRSLTSTSITVVLAPNRPGLAGELGFFFHGDVLPSLRETMQASSFMGIDGNLGYFMTPALIAGYAWSHNVRFPKFRLAVKPSYLGQHLVRESLSGRLAGSLPSAHPGAVGIRVDGSAGILTDSPVGNDAVTFEPVPTAVVPVRIVNEADAGADVVAFTPAFTAAEEVQRLTEHTEATSGADTGWQACRPMVPFPPTQGRINVFVANEGNGYWPVEKVAAVWEGAAPIPSFGAVLSFSRPCFAALFGSVARFSRQVIRRPVRIVPQDEQAVYSDYVQILGGLVPAVADGTHVLHEPETMSGVMRALGRYGATSPIAQCGRETRNFDPIVREPAGVLVQTATHIGWVIFDGRHELGVGASGVDAANLLRKLEDEGVLEGGVERAVLIDGGSAMKVYWVSRNGGDARLSLLNRVAGGSRNAPGLDREGHNLYSALRLHAKPSRTVEEA